MKLSWLLNGTLEAHHLVAAYVAVWLTQGGYAAWIAREWLRTKKQARTIAPLTSVTREDS
jgi:hypothetical protein